MRDFKYTSIDSLTCIDGPGLRTIIFLADCPYRCIYCHNVETFIPSEYKNISVDDLISLTAKNQPFYGENGGITFSGGEPLLQKEAIMSFLDSSNILVAIETAGVKIDDGVLKILPRLQHIFIDLKWNCEEDYQKYSAGSLATTIEFIKAAKRFCPSITIRHVVVPTINDEEAYIMSIADLVDSLGLEKVEFLPYHDMAKEKYEKYKIFNHLKDQTSMDVKKLEKLLLPARIKYPKMII